MVGHTEPGPQGQFVACQREDGRMGARTSDGRVRHSYGSVSRPSAALREVIAKRWMIGSGELVGVSRRVQSLPAMLRDRLRAYWMTCLHCKFELAQEVARELWPLFAAKIASLGGMLECWLLKCKEGPRGGWVFGNPRFRQVGDAADGSMPRRKRTALEVFRKTHEEFDGRDFLEATRGRIRRVRREREFLGSASLEAQRCCARDLFGK